MFEVLLLSFALSMDAFAVSIGLGAKNLKKGFLLGLKIAFFFGFFQFFMPLVGYFANVGVGKLIDEFDHWIAFILLVFIGGKMLYESFKQQEDTSNDNLTNRFLLILSIATSIDAMAAGFTLNLLKINPYISVILIGVITFIVCLIGFFIGKKGGEYLESYAEKLGGLILIGLGIKILIQHLFFI